MQQKCVVNCYWNATFINNKDLLRNYDFCIQENPFLSVPTICIANPFDLSFMLLQVESNLCPYVTG